MKAKKVLKVTFIVLVVVALLLALVVLFWLGPVVKAVAQSIGSKALGTPVSIESLAINPRTGTVDLKAFTIDTHEGFARTNTWSLADLHLSIDMGSLFSDTIVVHEVRIDSPYFTYEQNRATDNVAEIVKALQEFAGVDPDATKERQAKEAAAKDDGEKASKKVIVESLVVNDLQVHIANTDDLKQDVRLAVEQFSLSFTNGVVQLKNLTLGNPDSLATPNLFELEAIDIQLDPDSIYSDKVVIEDVQIRHPHVFLEINPETDTIAEFMKIAGGVADKAKPPPADKPADLPEPETETTGEPAAPPPIELKNLYVDDIQLKLLDTTRTNAPTEPQALATVGGISVRQTEGKLQIKGIAVPNPDGFTATNLFHLASIEVSIDPASLFSPQVVISEVRIDSPTFNLERTETKGNVAELTKLLKALTPPAPETGQTVAASEPEEAVEPVPLAEQPVVLEALVVTNLAINMIFPVETNGLASAVSFPSLGKLSPMGLLGGQDTNAVDEVEVDGQLTFMAFDLLTIEPLKGLIELTNLEVGNPDGFANKNLVQLDQFNLAIDPSTLQADVMLIEEILIDNPTIAYERKITTDNFQALQAFIEDVTTPLGEESETETVKAEEPEQEASGQKVIIGHLLVKSGLVKAKLSIAPSAPIPLPKIEMRDIGKEKGGTGFFEACAEIGQKFYDTILGAVASTTGFATDALKGIGSLALPGGEKELTGIDAITGEQLGPDTTESVDTEDAGSESATPAAEKPEKKRRSSRTWRLPGRSF